MSTRPTAPAADGAVILGQLDHALTRYVILPSAEAAVAVALWIAATHAQAAWQHAPRLVIRARKSAAASPGCWTSWKAPAAHP